MAAFQPEAVWDEENLSEDHRQGKRVFWPVFRRVRYGHKRVNENVPATGANWNPARRRRDMEALMELFRATGWAGTIYTWAETSNISGWPTFRADKEFWEDFDINREIVAEDSPSRRGRRVERSQRLGTEEVSRSRSRDNRERREEDQGNRENNDNIEDTDNTNQRRRNDNSNHNQHAVISVKLTDQLRIIVFSFPFTS